MSRTRSHTLRLIKQAALTHAKAVSSIVHDPRGNAIWVGEPATLEGAGALTLATDESAPTVFAGDPYNQPPRVPARTLAGKKRP